MVSTPVRVPVERAEVDTTDIGYAHEVLTQAYVDHRAYPLHDPVDFVFRSRSARAGELRIDRVTHTAPMRFDTEAFGPRLFAWTLLAGSGAVGQGRGQRRLAPGDSLLSPFGRRLTGCWNRMRTQAVQFPYSALAAVARRLGVEPTDLRFDGTAPVSAALNRHWLATVAYLARSFAGPDPAVAHPLLLASAVQNIASAVLTVFPNTTMSVDYLAGPGRVPPATVRRAIAYIDGHADQPITLEDIAAAARITVRGLQAAFARHRDTSPSGYLRRVRLHRAHQDLQTGDPTRGDTVAGIARRWGFTAPGRFAAEYRTLFGQSPAHTLRT